MILKMDRDYSHTNIQLGLERISLYPSTNRKYSKVSPLYTHSEIIYGQVNDTFLHIGLFSFQLARGGIESVVYEKLIAPFKNDLPVTHSDGFRRVCVDPKYAHFGPYMLNTKYSLSFPCQLVPLPKTFYRDAWAFMISKNSSYKGLINWR